MADQLEQEQLELEATGAPDVAVDPMGGAGAPVAPAAEEAPGFDLEALLGEIESNEMAAAPAAPTQGGQSALEEFKAAREALAREEEFEQQDVVTKRFSNIEGELQRIKAERDAIVAQKLRDNINTTINATVGDELTRLEIDPTTGPGKAFARLLANSAMVAVAKEQTRMGRQDIDLNSVQRQVKNYAKLLERVSSEVATKQTSKQRRAAAGVAKTPVTPSKPVGDMSDEEFDAAVLAAFTNR
tara:strand:- start:8498 stop:9226 length:729 start_codon:yes stop_codon:yes gene_type:complete